MPPLSGNGWMICGDAAQMVNAAHREGTNLAVTSGKLAGEVALLAHQTGDFSNTALDHYDKAIRASFIHKDLKKYRGLHGLLGMENSETLFGKLPEALNEAAYQWLLVDGVTKKEKQKIAMRELREAAGGNLDLLRLGLKGWRAING